MFFQQSDSSSSGGAYLGVGLKLSLMLRWSGVGNCWLCIGWYNDGTIYDIDGYRLVVGVSIYICLCMDVWR